MILLIGYFLCDDDNIYPGCDIDRAIYEKLDSTELYTLTFNEPLFEKYSKDDNDLFAVKKCKNVTNVIAGPEGSEDYLSYIEVFFEQFEDEMVLLTDIQLPTFGFKWDDEIVLFFLTHANVIAPTSDQTKEFARKYNVECAKRYAFEQVFGLQFAGARFVLRQPKLRL